MVRNNVGFLDVFSAQVFGCSWCNDYCWLYHVHLGSYGLGTRSNTDWQIGNTRISVKINVTRKQFEFFFLKKNHSYLCWNHDAKVLAIDTVRAFHLSFGYLVEVDIVLPETMLLKEVRRIFL